MTWRDLYYLIKPIIPRRTQISIRRSIAAHKRKKVTGFWPILPKAAQSPNGWNGWPDHKRFALILCHDVDTEKGHSQTTKLMSIEQELGFKSSFNFVPEDYRVSQELRERLIQADFEVGVHGLKHDGNMFRSRKLFDQRAPRINAYLKEWQSVGFYSPSMYRQPDWIAELDIEYACSTFDTDPFEPQPNGVDTIFPLRIWNAPRARGYIELPYTLPQDHLLFILLKEKDISIWSRKLYWIAEKGGMVRVNVHPDYMNFSGSKCALEEYPAGYYKEFLEHIKRNFEGQYWHVLPRDLARFWRNSI